MHLIRCKCRISVHDKASVILLLCYSHVVIAALLQMLCYIHYVAVDLSQPLFYSYSYYSYSLALRQLLAISSLTYCCFVIAAMLQVLYYSHYITTDLLQLLCYIYSVSHIVISAVGDDKIYIR